MARVFLSVGSNLGDRLECLRRAVGALRAMHDLHFLDASPLYRTEPWERESAREQADDGGWFFNCAVVIETELEPAALLTRLQSIEDTLGRVRRAGTPEAQRFEPRTLDIDILLYDDRVISGPEHLHIPHLLMSEMKSQNVSWAEAACGISVSCSGFTAWIRSGNLMASWMKKTGMLFPTRSKTPSSV